MPNDLDSRNVKNDDAEEHQSECFKDGLSCGFGDHAAAATGLGVPGSASHTVAPF
jgi:hypothetical protein